MSFDEFPHAGDEPEDPAPEDREHNVSRMTLRQVLFTGMEDVITFDRRFTHYTQHADGRVTAHFDRRQLRRPATCSSARTARARRCGASTSRTRRTPRPAWSAIGGKTLLTERAEALLPEPVRNGFGMYFDRRGQFGITHVDADAVGGRGRGRRHRRRS